MYTTCQQLVYLNLVSVCVLQGVSRNMITHEDLSPIKHCVNVFIVLIINDMKRSNGNKNVRVVFVLDLEAYLLSLLLFDFSINPQFMCGLFVAVKTPRAALTSKHCWYYFVLHFLKCEGPDTNH